MTEVLDCEVYLHEVELFGAGSLQDRDHGPRDVFDL